MSSLAFTSVDGKQLYKWLTSLAESALIIPDGVNHFRTLDNVFHVQRKEIPWIKLHQLY
jgi:hypothetical protein